jgi:hypothetical protein
MKQGLFWILSVISLVIYVGLAYFTSRAEFPKLLLQVSALYMMLFAIWNLMRHGRFEFYPVTSILWTGLLLRFALLFVFPGFSDDYFRFIWDGEMTVQGVSPYMFLPAELISRFSDNHYLLAVYEGLNSKNYFSVYPPLNQYMFAAAAWLFNGNLLAQVIVLKTFVFLAEVITMIKLPGLFSKLKLNPALSVFYILNPLVILEGVGNLHFEPVSICFIVLSLTYLFDEKFGWSALFLALAVSVKLVPLILIPLFFRYLSFNKALKYCALVLFVFVALFIPFLDSVVLTHIFSSIELYYQTFEFNASVYYVIRKLGYLIKGYNVIGVAGILLILLFLLALITISLKVRRYSKMSLLTSGFWVFLSYYFLSTTVHPWYIINVLLFGLLAGYYRSVVFWTGFCFLSYSAYSTADFTENVYLIAFEYLAFLLVLMHEYKQMAIFKMNIDNSDL